MIDVSCFAFGQMGIQVHGSNFVLALDKIESVALRPWDHAEDMSEQPQAIRSMLDRAVNSPRGDISLGLGNINLMPGLIGENKIAHVVWETSLIPDVDLAKLEGFKQIWTPSEWGKQILLNNGIADTLIRVVPEGVDTKLYRPTRENHEREKPTREKPFRFLFVGKWEERKGIDILLYAYSNAFRADEPVELVLHSSTMGQNLNSIVSELDKVIAPRVRSSTSFNSDEMVNLYNSCDAFVSATRGEGWGLPIIEAMACAKPVIVTDYSAHLEFANSQNAYLIEVEKMIDVDDPVFFDPNCDFGQWAEPSADHLTHLLRHVYENAPEADELGERARADVSANWTWDLAAQKAHSEIQQFRESV